MGRKVPGRPGAGMLRPRTSLVHECFSYEGPMEELFLGLPTLLVLARSGSVTSAAAQLGVPRSTVSRRLARLETHLGVPLAERNTRSFKLTPAAHRLVGEAGTLLMQLQTAAETIRAEAGEVRGKLRVASPPGLGGNFVGRFLAQFQRQHPGVEVELVVTERRPHLIEEQFDLVLSTDLLTGLPWKRRRLGRTWSIAVASPAYLRSRPAPEAPEALTNHVVLASHQRGEAVATWPRLKGPPLLVRPALLTNDLPTLRVAALEGLGIALLPAHLLLEDLASNALVQVLAEHIGAPLEIYALYVRERRTSPVLRAFFASIEQFTAPLVPGEGEPISAPRASSPRRKRSTAHGTPHR